MSGQATGDVTALLRRLGNGDDEAAEQLYSLVYEQLRRLAQRISPRGAQGTLQPTALVHEVYLKLAGAEGCTWNDRAHLMAVSARAMRQIITDHARAKAAAKRGGARQRVTLTQLADDSAKEVDVLVVDQVLSRLRELNERHAALVELRVFAGFTLDEIAVQLSVSKRTLSNDWRFVQAWLVHELQTASA